MSRQDNGRSFHNLSQKEDQYQPKLAEIVERLAISQKLRLAFQELANKNLEPIYSSGATSLSADIIIHQAIPKQTGAKQPIVPPTAIITISHPDYAIRYLNSENQVPTSFNSPTDDLPARVVILPEKRPDGITEYRLYAHYGRLTEKSTFTEVRPDKMGFHHIDKWRYILQLHYKRAFSAEDFHLGDLFSDPQNMYCLPNKLLRAGLGEVDAVTRKQVVTIRSMNASLQLPISKNINIDLETTHDGKEIWVHNPSTVRKPTLTQTLAPYWTSEVSSTISIYRKSSSGYDLISLSTSHKIRLKQGDIVTLGKIEKSSEDTFLAFQAYRDPSEWNKLGIALYPFRQAKIVTPGLAY